MPRKNFDSQQSSVFKLIFYYPHLVAMDVMSPRGSCIQRAQALYCTKVKAGKELRIEDF